MENNFFYFWLCWLGLGLGSFLFFHFNKNAGLKRFILPFFLVFAGAVFLYIVWLEIRDIKIFFVAAGFTAIITFLNFRKTRFCNNCGSTVYGRKLIARPKECPRCETALD
jgi:hypothetical protein